VAKRTAIALLTMLCWSCRHTGYTVIERTNTSEMWVNVVLEHDGHKYFTRCNNYKAAGNYVRADTEKILRCELHVGQTVDCKAFKPGENGYDLICGHELVRGQLTTSGGNELLIIQKEER
jgi:hypothetical protein